MSFFRRAGALIARFFTSAVDPAAVAGEFKLYSKVDGIGDSQLYGRSDNGDVYKITPTVSQSAFLFVALGTETDVFFVPFPTPRADTDYIAVVTSGIQATGPYTVAAPTNLYQTTGLYLMTGIPPNPGDTFSLVIHDVTAGGVMPVPADGALMIAGQSNAVGQGDAFTIGAPWTLPDYDIQLNATYSNRTDPLAFVPFAGALRPYAPPAGANMGTELELGRALVAAGHNLIITKFGVNGTNLADDWNPAGTYPAFPLGGPKLFELFITAILAEQNDTGFLIGPIVWIQGENDAQDAGDAAAYGANLIAFVAAVRAALGRTVPFIIVPMSPLMSPPFTADVITGQAAFVAGDGGNSALVSVAGLLSVTGGIHYSSTDLVTLGDRISAAVIPFL